MDLQYIRLLTFWVTDKQRLVRLHAEQSRGVTLNKVSLYDPFELQVTSISNGVCLMCIVPIWFW